MTTTSGSHGGRALVVGCSDGIGLALVRRLLAEGWSVAGVSRRESPVEHEAYEHVVADVAGAGYGEVLEGLLAGGGDVTLCVYCAGTGDGLDVEDLAAETRTLDVNLLGAARTVERVVPPMLRRGSGQVMVLSSLADVLVSPEAPSYAASKAGLSFYVEGLGLALRPRGVTVTNLRLGFVDTKMAKSPWKPFLVSAERAVDWVDECMRRRPLRMSRPRRMAWLTGLVAAGQRLVRALRG